MFIGYYELENNEPYFDLYYKNESGWRKWHEDTFCNVYNIEMLDFKISGKTYAERKCNLEELAKDWQTNFAWLGWSYSELAEIGDFFYRNGKRYGLLREFKENCIC